VRQPEFSPAFKRADVQETDGTVFWLSEGMKGRWWEIKSGLDIGFGRPVFIVTENADLQKRIQKETAGMSGVSVLNGEKALLSRLGTLPRLSLSNLQNLLSADDDGMVAFFKWTSLTFVAPRDLNLDFGGLPPDSPFMNVDTVFLLLDELLRTTPIRAVQLEEIYHIAQNLAQQA
jgi:hypothetical protein